MTRVLVLFLLACGQPARTRDAPLRLARPLCAPGQRLDQQVELELRASGVYVYQALTDIQHQPITDLKADETLAGHKVTLKIAACDFDKPCDMDHAPSTETTMGGTRDELVLDLPPTFQARCAAQ